MPAAACFARSPNPGDVPLMDRRNHEVGPLRTRIVRTMPPATPSARAPKNGVFRMHHCALPHAEVATLLPLYGRRALTGRLSQHSSS